MEEKNNGEGKGGKYLERENVTMAGQTTNKERSGFFGVKFFLRENLLEVKIFSIEHDLARSSFMLYTPSYGNSQLKMEIFEFTSKEASAPLMPLAAPLWFWKLWKKNLDFGIFFPKF